MTPRRKQSRTAPPGREHLVNLDARRLLVHPRNMRRVYPLCEPRDRLAQMTLKLLEAK